MQIAQFVVGSSFALAHLFIAYTIPVNVPYVYSLADLTSALTSDLSSAASVATATATAGLGSWLKKIAFRAAGEEGLAENVQNEQGKPFGIDAIHAAKDLKMREEIRYRDELRMIHCTDTSGQVFAILINCFYLFPLTWLFVRFFIRSYTRRGEQQQSGNSSKLQLIEESGKDATKNVKKELDQALDEEPGSIRNGIGTTKSSSKETRSTMSKPSAQDSKQGEEEPSGDAKKQRVEEGNGDSNKQKNGNNERGPRSSSNISNSNLDSSGQNQHRVGNEASKAESYPNKSSNKSPDSKSDNADAANVDDEDDTEKYDVEILDSADAVTDVLDSGMEAADKFGKELENSKAG
jgi:GNS1/SUR4 family